MYLKQNNGSRYPTRQYENPNRIFSPDAIPSGFQYWQIKYTGTLAELQFDAGEGFKTFTAANGITAFSGADVSHASPDFAALSDGVFGGGGTSQYVGRTGDFNECTISIVFATSKNILRLGFYPREGSSAGSISTCPGRIKVLNGADGVIFSEIKDHQVSTNGSMTSSTTFDAQGLIQGQLNVIDLV